MPSFFFRLLITADNPAAFPRAIEDAGCLL